MVWLIIFGPVLEVLFYGVYSRTWGSEFSEIKPIIIFSIVLYTLLVIPILIWKVVLNH
ncbi:hypothetical protein [Bacillus massilinigeriensis]|uniref:hypothetical protein n=1 Tax=Bacillus massilionigeriensis TaxID=1805475 RepID=UPI0013563FDA|nr:hypothetical protein [Bacillus massilionigeriensis]